MKCHFKLSVILLLTMLLFSCGGQTDGKLTTTNSTPESENTAVNVNEQAKPNLLIMPGDALLKKFGMLNEQDAQGKTIYIRDFNGYFLKDPNAKFIFSNIQSAFINLGFPLNDLEQTIKSINDQEMLDDVDNIQKDAKTLLLTNAKPDIIIELDYDMVDDMTSRNLNRSLTFTLRAIDAFSNKVVATIQQANFGKDSNDNDASSLMKKALDIDMPSYTSQINSYFSDIIQKGREITVRVSIDKAANLKMEDDCLQGDTYADFIVDYLKVNTQKGAYKLQRNTSTEIYFQNVRIKTLNENGTQYSAYDFAKDLKKALDKGCGIKSKNNTQGLGDAFIVLKGM
jgi:hypothetical protein